MKEGAHLDGQNQTRMFGCQVYSGLKATENGFLDLLLLSLLFCVPFLVYSHFYPLTSFWLEFTSFFIFTCFLCIFSYKKFSSHQKNTVYSHVFVLGFVGIALVTTIQALLGRLVFLEQLFWPLLYFLTASVAISVGIRYQNLSELKKLEKGFVAALLFAWVFNFILVTIQNLGWNFSGWSFPKFDTITYAPGGFLSQRNQMCVLAMMAWIGLMLPATFKWLPKAFFWLFYLLIPASIILTRGRTGIAILLVTVPFFLFAQYRGVIKQGKLYTLLILGVLPLYFVETKLMATMNVLPEQGRGDAITRVANIQEYSSRYYTQIDALHMLERKPLIGIGAGNFLGERYNTNQISAQGSGLNAQSNIAHTHNLFTQLLVEWGIIGFLFIFIPLLIWFVSIFRRIWKKEFEEDRLFSVALTIPIWVYAMIEYPHWYGFFLIPCLFLMGVSGGGVIRFTSTKLKHIVSTYTPYFFKILTPLMVALCIWIGFDYNHTETLYAYRVFPEQYAQEGKFLTRKELDNALATPFFRTEKSYLKMGILEPTPPKLKEKTAFVEEVSKRLPYPDVITRLIVFYVVEGRLDEALEHANRLRRWDTSRYADLVQVIERNSALFGGNFTTFLNRLPSRVVLP